MGSHRHYEVEEVLEGDKMVLVLSENGKPIGSSDRLVFNKKDDRMKRHENYRIRFSIKDFGSSRLRFVPDLKDVFWVQGGSSCPTSRSAMPDVIYVDENDCAKDGRYIEVINRDKIVQDFWFTLNFVDKSISNPKTSDYEPLDPGGTNQNHGEPFMAMILCSGFVGGIVGLVTDFLAAGDGFTASTGAGYAFGGALIGLVIGLIADRM